MKPKGFKLHNQLVGHGRVVDMHIGKTKKVTLYMHTPTFIFHIEGVMEDSSLEFEENREKR